MKMHLEQSFHEFASSMREGKAVSINKTGEWHVENWVVRLVKWILGLRDKRIIKICNVINNFLEELERRPILFDIDEISFTNQKDNLQSYISIASETIRYLKKFRSKKIVFQSKNLQKSLIGLKYRIEWINGGLKPLNENEINPKIYELILKKASQWKSGQKIYNEEDSKLHPLDIQKIAEVCRYEEFTSLLFSDKNLADNFFSWTLKNCNPVKEFIEYPAITQYLKKALLSGRIGHLAYEKLLTSEKTSILEDENNPAKIKILTLPFEGKKISILDENRLVKLKGDNWVAIRDIFHDMKMKNIESGEFEFIGKQGFTNWCSYRMASWNALKNEWQYINLSQEKWWESLPIQEIIPTEEVIKRLELNEELNETNWILIARSSRQSPSFNIDECHGYTGVIIPYGHGKWRVYDFGKFAKEWPKGIIGSLGMIGNTVKADYVYPDPNIYYSGFRQQAAVPFIVSQEEGERFFNERIRKNIIKGWQGNLVFMFGWENCAYSPQKDIESILGKESEGGRVPNLFISPILSSGARKPLHHAFKIINKLPKIFHKPLVRLCDLTLCSWRGVYVKSKSGSIKKKSLNNSPYQNGFLLQSSGKTEKVFQHIFLPSEMHRKIIEGKIQGVVWTGHQRTQVSE